MSFTKLTYHIVFATKNRGNVIDEQHERVVYAAINNYCKDKGATVFRIGGMPDHVHLLVDLPPNVSLTEFVKVVKQKSSQFIRDGHILIMWSGWQEGYGGFTVSYSDIDKVIDYIKGQKDHHRTTTFAQEYRQWLKENGIDENEPYFPK